METSFGVTCKIKVKLAVHAVEAYGEMEVLQYVYLTSALGRDEHSACTQFLYLQGQIPQSLLNTKLGDLQSLCGHYGEQKTVLLASLAAINLYLK